jgi:hypothetical protein
MPTFKKGVFQDIEYKTAPVGFIRNVFRFLPYAPGDYLEFNIFMKSMKNDVGGVKIFLSKNGKETHIGTYSCDNAPHKVPKTEIQGEGTVDYIMKLIDRDESVLVVSAAPTHNDWITPFILGSLFTLIFTIIAWLLSRIP